MGTKLYDQKIIVNIIDFIDNSILKRWRSASPEPENVFYWKIYQFEQKLSQGPTRSMHSVRHRSTFLEPVTEQQKIMDMSG